jgi:hypothetical protein
MTTGLRFEPQAVYDDGALYCTLGLTATTLARARRSGRLRFTRQGKRTFYLGEWVLNWLSDGDSRDGEAGSQTPIGSGGRHGRLAEVLDRAR